MKIFHTISSIVLAIIIFVVGFYMGSSQTEQQTISLDSVGKAHISIMIDYGNDKLSIFEVEDVAEGDSVFDSLLGLQEQGQLELAFEDYGGDMGVFLQGIDGVGVNEDAVGSKWWHYWVNGSYAQVGASSQKVNPGDVILFKYTLAQESATQE